MCALSPFSPIPQLLVMYMYTFWQLLVLLSVYQAEIQILNSVIQCHCFSFHLFPLGTGSFRPIQTRTPTRPLPLKATSTTINATSTQLSSKIAVKPVAPDHCTG